MKGSVTRRARINQTLRSVFTHVRPYLVFVPTYGTWFEMAIAVRDVDALEDTAEQFTRRVHERELGERRFCSPATHFAAFALPNFVLEFLRSKVPVVTDDGPRLDEDPEFGEGVNWNDDLRSQAVENAFTCRTDP